MFRAFLGVSCMYGPNGPDVLVPAMATLKIPVSCVEQGRWRSVGETFTAGKSASHRTRSSKQERVRHALRWLRFMGGEKHVFQRILRSPSRRITTLTYDLLFETTSSSSGVAAETVGRVTSERDVCPEGIQRLICT